ncbi:unnamed protein product [Knipowitschia caucasica]
MAESSVNPKLPIPRLPSKAAPTSKQKKSPGTKLADRRLRDHRRIYLGAAFQRWRDLRLLKGFKTDPELAMYLLDSYEKRSDSSTSTPRRNIKRKRLVMPALSSIAESLSEREEDFYEVLPIGSDDDGKRIQADEVDENDVNSLQNSIIDWTEDETWTPSKDTEEVSTSEEETRKEDSESDDSDTDYIPTIRIRPGASLAYNIDELPVATAEDIVYDGIGQDPHLPPCDDPSIPCNSIRVETPEDIVGQQAAIVYDTCLKQLVTFLQMPIRRCPAKTLKDECGATGPFEVFLVKRGSAVLLKWV